MRSRRTVVGLFLLVLCLFAAALAMLLLQSEKLALGGFAAGTGLAVLLVEPFVGLLNYVIFVYVRPQEFMAGFKGLPVMLVLGSATLASTVFHQVIRRRSPLRVPQDFIMLWLFVAVVLSHLANLYVYGAIDSSKEFLSRLTVYFLFSMLVVTTRRLKTGLYLLVLLTLFQAVHGIYQFHTGVGLGGQTMIDQRIQGIGIFADPNVLAMTFLSIMPFIYLSMCKSRSLVHKGAMLGCMAVLVYGLYLTDSRGGFLTFGVMAMIMFAKRFGPRIGLALGGVSFLGLVAMIPSRLQEFSMREESAYGRVEAWAVGFGMLETHPIFGVGAWAYLDHHFREAHNSFVHCASELGLFGLFAWVLLFVVTIRHLNFVRKDKTGAASDELKLYAESTLYGIVAFAVSALFISRAYNDLLYILIGLGVGVTNVFTANSSAKHQLLDRKDIAYTGYIVVGSLLAIKAFLMLYW